MNDVKLPEINNNNSMQNTNSDVANGERAKSYQSSRTGNQMIAQS